MPTRWMICWRGCDLNTSPMLTRSRCPEGEKRRLSVATVLAASPQLLILDEPTFGQDANTWAELASLLTELLDAGTAVVSP